MSERKPIVHSEALEFLFSADEEFLRIHEAFGAPPQWQRPEGFVSLCQIILEQQVSLASGKAHFERLKTYLGDFTPENMARLTPEEFRECHISRQKGKYLSGLAAAIVNGSFDLERLGQMAESEAREQLLSLKGIGNWTADIYLMFCLQSPDILPLGDIAVVNTLKRLWGFESKEAMEQYTQKWKPFRSLATFFLWHHYLEKKKGI